MMIRSIIFFVLFSFCCSCRNENVELRGDELFEQISSVKSYNTNKRAPIDSLVALSVALSPVERYAVLFHAVQNSLNCSDSVRATRYLQLLDSLAFPEVHDKASGFLLLKCYHVIAFNLLDFAPQLADPKKIASLLFDMENRWRLTPQEKLRFLIMKSGIYFNVFRENKSAVLIVRDGITLARECGADQKMVMDLFRVMFQGSLRLEEDSLMVLGNDFAELAETCQFDSLAKGTINKTLGMLYEQQGYYQKAYDFLSREKTVRSERYFPVLTRVYAGMDSISAALDYIEYWRKKNPHLVVLANMAWDEASVRQQMGDSVGYKRCVQESVELFNRHSRLSVEVHGCAPSEAYARILWQEGKHSEAIWRMESVSSKLISGVDYGKRTETVLHDLTPRINRFRLLRDYYNRAGRPADALRQSLLCDSLEQQLAKKRLREERQKTTTAMYTMDLMHNLDLRAMEFQQERQKLYVACLMLGVALLLLVVLWVLYRQRQRQLNVLYMRQKEIEQLQAEKQRITRGDREKLSPEEQLFRELERQFYEEELFRNPGFSRDDLCRLGGSNRMYVSTCINKCAGTNINQWINKARIDYAIRLIGEGEGDLIILSELSGFSSIKSFFRSFKQFTNLSPRQYIVRDREKNEQEAS